MRKYEEMLMRVELRGVILPMCAECIDRGHGGNQIEVPRRGCDCKTINRSGTEQCCCHHEDHEK